MFDKYDWPTQFRSYSPDSYANPFSNIKGGAVGKDFAQAVESAIRGLGFLGVDDLIRKPGGGKSRVGLEILQSVISGLAPYYNTTANMVNNERSREFNVPSISSSDTSGLGINTQSFLNNLFNNIKSEFQPFLNKNNKLDTTNTTPFYEETNPQSQIQQMSPSQRAQSQQVSLFQQTTPSQRLTSFTKNNSNNVSREKLFPYEPDIFRI